MENKDMPARPLWSVQAGIVLVKEANRHLSDELKAAGWRWEMTDTGLTLTVSASIT